MQLEDVPPTNSASGASFRNILFSQRRLYRFQRPFGTSASRPVDW